MAADDWVLDHWPDGSTERQQELWLQHAAGLVLVEDVRGYARSRLDRDLGDEVRQVAERAIDDALYGLMMVADGVTGAIRGDGERVVVSVAVRRERLDGEVVQQLDLFDGDGACVGYHGWVGGDVGDLPVHRR